VIGNPEDDLLALLGRLIEKIRRGISVKYIEDTEQGPQIADSLGAKTIVQVSVQPPTG